LGDAINKDHDVRSFQEVTETEEGVPIPTEMMRKSNISVWRVEGGSVTGDHLLNGDHLILDKLSTPRDGDMVAALVRKSVATLRRFYRDGHRIRLEDADPSGESAVFEEKEVDILGVVVGILRKYRSSPSGAATKCRSGTKRSSAKV
jgi:repressor LexA